MKRIDRYILGAVLVPLCFVLGIAVTLLVLEQMLRLFQFVLTENGEIGVVWRLLFWLLPEYVSLALPIGFMLGVMFAFRRFALSSELRAMFASGASLLNLLAPVFLLGLVLATVNLVIVGYVQPFSAYQYSRLKFEVQSQVLTAQVQPGVFFKVNETTILRIEGRAADQVWRQVFLESCPKKNRCTVLTAARGVIVDEPSPRGELLLRLFDGRQVEVHDGAPTDAVIGFGQWDVAIEVGTPKAFRSRGGEKQEITLDELVRRIYLDEPAKVIPAPTGTPVASTSGSDRATIGGSSAVVRGVFAAPPAALAPDPLEKAKLVASLHWRILHVLLMLIIPFAAAPLALTEPRRDSALGILLGIAGILLYFKLNQAGEAQIARGSGSPWLVMWPMAALFAAGSITLLQWSVSRPGVRPLAPLEAPFEAAANFVRSLWGRWENWQVKQAQRRMQRLAKSGKSAKPRPAQKRQQIGFFGPNQTLVFYLARAFLTRFFIVLFLMISVLQILDLLSNSDEISAGIGAQAGYFWRYIALKLPAFVTQFSPFAALLATLAMLAEFNHRGEINAIRSSGVSALELVMPLCIVCLSLGMGLFAFQEWVAIPSAEKLGRWRDAHYATGPLPADDVARRDVLIADGATLILADSAVRQADNSLLLRRISLVERSPSGLMERFSKVREARLKDGVLVGQRVDQLNLDDANVFNLLRAWWPITAPVERIMGRKLEVEEANLGELWTQLTVANTIGERAPVLATAFFHRFSAPLAILLMPLLAAVAGFGSNRGGGLIKRLLLGAGLGFTFFVAENALIAMGNLGALLPVLAAFLPFFGFLCVGIGAVLLLED